MLCIFALLTPTTAIIVGLVTLLFLLTLMAVVFFVGWWLMRPRGGKVKVSEQSPTDNPQIGFATPAQANSASPVRRYGWAVALGRVMGMMYFPIRQMLFYIRSKL